MNTQDFTYVTECIALGEIEAAQVWLASKMSQVMKEGYERGQADLASQVTQNIIESPTEFTKKDLQRSVWAYVRQTA